MKTPKYQNFGQVGVMGDGARLCNSADPWFQTYSGKKFHYLNPTPDSIDFRDIAHSLAALPRFLGHTSNGWTVAEHSLAVMLLCPPHSKLFGLLHDAAEAYIGDIPTPLRTLLPQLDDIESRIQEAIRKKIGICAGFDWDPIGIPQSIVHKADRAMLFNEATQFLPVAPDWLPDPPPVAIQGMLGSISALMIAGFPGEWLGKIQRLNDPAGIFLRELDILIRQAHPDSSL